MAWVVIIIHEALHIIEALCQVLNIRLIRFNNTELAFLREKVSGSLFFLMLVHSKILLRPILEILSFLI